MSWVVYGDRCKTATNERWGVMAKLSKICECLIIVHSERVDLSKDTILFYDTLLASKIDTNADALGPLITWAFPIFCYRNPYITI